MPELLGRITHIDEENKLVTLSYLKDKKGFSKKFTVISDDIWELTRNSSQEIRIVYEEAEPYPVIKRAIGKMSFLIYGFNKEIQRDVSSKGKLSPYTRDLLSIAAAPLAIPSYSELDIILLGIVLAILLIFALYYFLIIPLLILILSIFTMGEAIKMLKRKILTIEYDSEDKLLCNKIRGIILTILKNKGSVNRGPKHCLSPDLRNYINFFRNIYKVFWTGMSLQGLSIILIGILYGLTKYLGWIPEEIFYYLEVVFAIIFAAGFFLSIWSGLRRKFTEVPTKLKYIQNS